ncbi:trypco2 family protein [Streptomyces coeruleoprunus]|uniref:Trypco2 family protein n=1 Tax=Streptomyces coeruleoprunus TaxID=285563 RepID=A0ABV9XKR5_9ACTN
MQELRRDLYAAQDAGAGQQLRFEAEQAQLTLEANGEVGGGLGNTSRQTLTLQVHDEALGSERALRASPSPAATPVRATLFRVVLSG